MIAAVRGDRLLGEATGGAILSAPTKKSNLTAPGFNQKVLC